MRQERLRELLEEAAASTRHGDQEEILREILDSSPKINSDNMRDLITDFFWLMLEEAPNQLPHQLIFYMLAGDSEEEAGGATRSGFAKPFDRAYVRFSRSYRRGAEPLQSALGRGL